MSLARARSALRLLAPRAGDADQGVHSASPRSRVVCDDRNDTVMRLGAVGFAINTTPRNLPTAVLLQETSNIRRTILAAIERTQYLQDHAPAFFSGRVRPCAS